MPMKYDAQTIEQNFASILPKPTLDQIRTFVNDNFAEDGSDVLSWIPDDLQPSPAFLANIKDSKLRNWASSVNQLWSLLGRQFDSDVYDNPLRHSLIPTRHNMMVVAGGRFREMYYWDSYWILRGLLVCGMNNTATKLVENLLGLVEDFGFVPNGNRRYYLSRSQPPLLTQMVDHLYNTLKNMTFLKAALPLLNLEYQFWMQSGQHAVLVNDTYNLNRYFAEVTYPRPESYREDEQTASKVDPVARQTIFSNLAAGAESGWDYSSRWFSDRNDLVTIDTTDVIPVDLNVIMYRNEQVLSHLYEVIGDTVLSQWFAEAAAARLKAIEAVFWDGDLNQWFDYNLLNTSTRPMGVLSNFLPLWGLCYDPSQVNLSAVMDALLVSDLIGPGGMSTTASNTTQQWDFPNAWAPLQHMIIEGLVTTNSKRGQQIAFDLAQIWIDTNYIAFNRTGYMFEKYNSQVLGEAGGGGEYTIQIGFGWTNGVALTLLQQYGDSLRPPF